MSMSIIKPMLASSKTPTESEIVFPVLASPKIDGVRCLIRNGIAMSRSWKKIRNQFVQKMLGGRAHLHGLDGELVVGSPTDPNCMQNSMAVTRKSADEIDFTFFVFDRWDMPAKPYRARLAAASGMDHDRIKTLAQTTIKDYGELLLFERQMLQLGYEGVIIRSANGHYKYGRSTIEEGLLLKVKRFSDGEARITGWKEERANNNPKTRDALGRQKRSHRKEGLVGKGTLGALIGIDIKTGQEVDCGTGFSAEQRKVLWRERESLIGKVFTYKHFDNAGVVNRPRHPVFKAFRSEDDL